MLYAQPVCMDSPAPFDQLTPREQEAVFGVARGLEIKEIARSMGIGYHTAKMHIHSAKAKLGARNQLEVAILYHGGTPASMENLPHVEKPIESAPTWSSHQRFSQAR